MDNHKHAKLARLHIQIFDRQRSNIADYFSFHKKREEEKEKEKGNKYI